jgi:hypothetical protein
LRAGYRIDDTDTFMSSDDDLFGPDRYVPSVDLVHDTQAGQRSFGLGEGDGAVQFDDRCGGQAGEFAVQGRDLRPVARCLGVQGGDRALQRVGPAATQGDRPVEFGA